MEYSRLDRLLAYKKDGEILVRNFQKILALKSCYRSVDFV